MLINIDHQAPLLFRTQSFTQPEASQPEVVCRVLRAPEIFNQIAGYLIPRYEDLANLCRTSQLTARMVQSLWVSKLVVSRLLA